MTPEKLTELEALEAAAAPPTWREIQVITPHTPEHNLLVALRNNAPALFAAIREAWRERDEARAFMDGGQKTLDRIIQASQKQWEVLNETIKERDELEEELDFIAKEYGKAPIEILTEDAIRLKIALLTKERNEWSLFAKKAVEERDEARAALRNLLLSRDAAWTGGHDWQEAVDAAGAVLDGAEPNKTRAEVDP